MTLSPPCWTWGDSGWTASIGSSIRLVVRPVTPGRRRWQWDVQVLAPNRVVTYRSSSATHHERTAEAAQVAAWAALAGWLGATL